MNNIERLLKYKEINNSFKKKFTYRLNDLSGFFSEYNNMILAMVYCFNNELKFELSSENSTFNYIDFFIPFCEINNSSIHLEYNTRPNLVYRPFLYKWLFKWGIWRDYPFDRPKEFRKRRRHLQGEFFTQDLFRKIRKQNLKTQYYFPSLDIKGNLREVCSCFVSMIWNYQPCIEEKIKETIKSLRLPDNYLGLHIRWGDKKIEYNLQDIEIYMNALSEYSSNKHVYVLTDDYTVIEKLKENYPSYFFYTLCKPFERGYVHSDFGKISKKERINALIALLTSIEILSNSKEFVGTLSSNPGMFLGMKMEYCHFHAVDFDNWFIW